MPPTRAASAALTSPMISCGWKWKPRLPGISQSCLSSSAGPRCLGPIDCHRRSRRWSSSRARRSDQTRTTPPTFSALSAVLRPTRARWPRSHAHQRRSHRRLNCRRPGRNPVGIFWRGPTSVCTGVRSPPTAPGSCRAPLTTRCGSGTWPAVRPAAPSEATRPWCGVARSPPTAPGSRPRPETRRCGSGTWPAVRPAASSKATPMGCRVVRSPPTAPGSLSGVRRQDGADLGRGHR